VRSAVVVESWRGGYVVISPPRGLAE
jgi:hypothetical protein